MITYNENTVGSEPNKKHQAQLYKHKLREPANGIITYTFTCHALADALWHAFSNLTNPDHI